VTLTELEQLFADAGCERLYAKPLAENDNSKNQVYFGPGFEAVNLFPNQGIVADESGKSNSIFKAKLDFGWMQESGEIAPAPGAQLILYPQYPEVRFSGFLRGCNAPPSSLMRLRAQGRVLFLGVSVREQVLGFVIGADTPAAKEYSARFPVPTIGVFTELPLPHVMSELATRIALLRELRRISNAGWIDSKQLGNDGLILPCTAPQCGGFTLEAELGIPKNSKSGPDFHGWEVKQHNVSNFNRIQSGPITLMTPEPNGGYYKEEGPIAFVRKFGYPDKRGRPDRINFGGIHKAGVRHDSTHLTLRLLGYDTAKHAITDAGGAIELVADSGAVAASWNFAGLLKHWTRKHARAVYVPSQCQNQPRRQYRYGSKVRLAMRTDFLKFLKAMADGAIYYDPGIKVEGASKVAKVKRRSQFRVSSRDIPRLYEAVELVNL
jgi:hypothetical protein